MEESHCSSGVDCGIAYRVVANFAAYVARFDDGSTKSYAAAAHDLVVDDRDLYSMLDLNTDLKRKSDWGSAQDALIWYFDSKKGAQVKICSDAELLGLFDANMDKKLVYLFITIVDRQKNLSTICSGISSASHCQSVSPPHLPFHVDPISEQAETSQWQEPGNPCDNSTRTLIWASQGADFAIPQVDAPDPANVDGNGVYITDDQMFDMLGLRTEENGYAHVEPNDDASGPNNGGIDAEVVNILDNTRHVVHLLNRECTCREWQVSGKPCQHALRFICSNRQANMEDYVDDFFSLAKFKAAYVGIVQPMTDKSQWRKVDPGFKLHPPQLKRSAGRPKTQRFKAANEVPKKKRQQSKQKCKTCGELGHQSRGACPLKAPKKRKRNPPRKKSKKDRAESSEVAAAPTPSTGDGLAIAPQLTMMRQQLDLTSAHGLGGEASASTPQKMRSPVKKLATKKLTPKKKK